MFPTESVPERIGAYRVLKHVGRSGAAEVYVARMEGPLGFARDVTLKLVRFAFDEDARFGEDLAREAAIAARLNHPAILRMFDFFEHDRKLVLVLEQIEGASLDRLLAHVARRKQKLSDGALFYLGSQIANALAHAHGSVDDAGNLSPVIHRDIRPENIVAGWDGNVRLAGFGLGKILGHTPDSIAGTVRGTPGWMSPEQVRGERATVRSDVYGFGMLLWSLLSGNDPPTDGARPVALSSLRPDLPRELLMAVDAALEPQADRRRITCAELSQWMGQLVKPDAGREELREKILWLRATRAPGPKGETRHAPRPAKTRRAAAPASRQLGRRSGPGESSAPSSRAPSLAARGLVVPERPIAELPPSSRRHPSLPAPFPTHRPATDSSPEGRSKSGEMERASRPPRSSRNRSLRIPPPPPLPSDDADTRSMRSGFPAAETSGPSTHRVPISDRAGQPSVTVRTVSVAPIRFGPRPPRPGALHPHEDPTAGAFPPSEPSPFVPPHPMHPVQAQGGFAGFTLVNQLLLAGLTAGLVIAIGLLLIQRSSPAPETPKAPVANAPDSPAVVARPPEPIVVVQPPAPPPTAEALPVAVPAPTPPPPVEPLPDASLLDNTVGYLIVRGPSGLDVYLQGVRRGKTGEPLLVACGTFYMRLAVETNDRFPAWATQGQTVIITCRAITELKVEGTSRPQPQVGPRVYAPPDEGPL